MPAPKKIRTPKDSALDIAVGHTGVHRKILRGIRTVLHYLGLTPPPRTTPEGLPDFGFSNTKECRYADRVELTRGGMGAINCAFDNDLKRQTAMKSALPAVLSRPLNATRFVNEARITAQLEHPNIVPVHDIGYTESDGLYYTMKLVQGEALVDILDDLYDRSTERRETFTLHRLLMVFRDVCEAVGFAHSRGVVHLDIKPENIMVGHFGEVLLMDWGIAQYAESAIVNGLEQDEIALEVRAGTGEVRGTPAYMAPEQARGDSQNFSELTDIFLLGGCLYHILTLTPPYLGDSPEDILERASIYDGIDAPEKRSPHRQLPDEICRICMKAMAEKQEDRYQSVKELLADLDDYMGGFVLSDTRIFESGDVLMREGDAGKEAYVIVSGKVDVVREVAGEEVYLTSLGPGDTVGEMALLTDEQRSATVVAREKTEVQIITEDIMQSALRKLPPWFSNAVSSLANRLRLANGRMQFLLPDNKYSTFAQLMTSMRLSIYRQKTPTDPDNPPPLKLADTFKWVALSLGVGPDTLEHLIGTLCEERVLRRRSDGSYEVQDFDAFEALANYAGAVITRMKAKSNGSSENPRLRDLYERLIQNDF
jgi:CRP-like cAMP-binding protein/tRNA A-37 threonylcarbamoyl transferase component Bud32